MEWKIEKVASKRGQQKATEGGLIENSKFKIDKPLRPSATSPNLGEERPQAVLCSG